MIKVCLHFENVILNQGINLFLNVLAPDSNLLVFEQGADFMQSELLIKRMR